MSASNLSAPAAGKHMSVFASDSTTNTAHENARPSTGAIPALTMLPASANGAGRNTKQTDIPSKDSADYLVPLPIAEVSSRSAGKEVVYDLCIEGEHEYFANGVLVHNCMDASLYGSTHLRRMGLLAL